MQIHPNYVNWPTAGQYRLPCFDELPINAIFKDSPNHRCHKYIKTSEKTYQRIYPDPSKDWKTVSYLLDDSFVYKPKKNRKNPLYWIETLR